MLQIKISSFFIESLQLLAVVEAHWRRLATVREVGPNRNPKK
jgi:hypothetical protein